MNKSQIIKYLKCKNNENYNLLDNIFEKYCSDELFDFLSKYNFSKIEIFPKVSPKGNSMEICLTYQNIAANISLLENELEYSIYPLYASANEVNKNTFGLIYDSNFSFEDFINSIFEKMKNHKALKDISGAERKKKIFNIIANICLIIPVLFIGLMISLVLGFDLTIKLDFWWVIVFIIIPLVLYFSLSNKHKI